MVKRQNKLQGQSLKFTFQQLIFIVNNKSINNFFKLVEVPTMKSES